MRFITARKLYRAFPELDAYSDEQCERFIVAALGTAFRRCLRIVACAATSLALIAVIEYVAARLISFPRLSPGAMRQVLLVYIFAFIVGVPLLTIILRDLLLWRRIGYVLRGQGCCGNCRYSLVGMPLDEHSQIICPECGSACTVDPSLEELVRSDDGRLRLQPTGPRGHWLAHAERSRSRFAKRLSTALALLVLLPLLTAGGWELWIRYQASQARANLVTEKQLEQFLQSITPQATNTNKPATWLKQAANLMAAVNNDLEVDTRFRQPDGGRVYVNIVAAFMPFEGDETASLNPDQVPYSAIQHQQAVAAVRAYSEQGLSALLRQAAEAPTTKPAIDLVRNGPLTSQLDDTDRTLHVASLWAIARMQQASQADSLADFTEACIDFAAVTSISGRIKPALWTLSSRAIMTTVIASAISKHPSSDWIAATAPLESAPDFETIITRNIDFADLSQRDAIAWHFGDPSRSRWGKWSSPFQTSPGSYPFPDVRLGTYADNIRAATQYAATLRATLQAPLHQRLDRDVPAAPPLMLFQTTACYWDTQVMLDKACGTTISLAEALPVVVALERFRAQQGQYPEALAELTPKWLKSLPIDRMDGLPMKYRRVDPATDPLRRGYVLYSVGDDGVDNGGRGQTAPQMDGWTRFQPTPQGEDAIFNVR